MELIDKLQRLKQGSMSVDEYRQQMELLLLRAGLSEEERTSIARFLSGLNIEVRDKYKGKTKPMEFWGLHLQNPRKIRVRPY